MNIEAKYLISREGRQYGPYSVPQIQEYLASGNILESDLVSGEDNPSWVPLDHLMPELKSKPFGQARAISGTQKFFRWLIVAHAIVMVGGLIVGSGSEQLVQDAKSAAGVGENSRWFPIVGGVWLVLLVVSNIGLFFFKKWARYPFLVSMILMILASFLESRVMITSNILDAVDSVTGLLEGAALLIVFSPQFAEVFEVRRG